MDDFVSMHDFFDEITSFLIVHGPNLFNTLVVGLLKSLETLLQLDILASENLVVFCVSSVFVLGFCKLHLKKPFLISQPLIIASELGLEAFFLLVENLLALKKHIVVETQFFLIELVHSFHILHTLFKNLHLSFQFDLLLSLLVGILTHNVLKITSIIGLELLALFQIECLNLFMVIKKLVNFSFISVEDCFAFCGELGLNTSELLCVVISHLLKLRLHALNQEIDVLRHLLNCLDIVTIFLVDLLLELFDQLLLVADDFKAGSFLGFNVL